MANRETLDTLRLYLKRLLDSGMPVAGLVLYGSHARGDAQSQSDIDVLVLLNDDALTNDGMFDLWLRIEHLSNQVDTRIETWPVTVSRFENDEVSPLIIIARREGIRIAA
jgi:predicted nucleotidyltransferase